LVSVHTIGEKSFCDATADPSDAIGMEMENHSSMSADAAHRRFIELNRVAKALQDRHDTLTSGGAGVSCDFARMLQCLPVIGREAASLSCLTLYSH
jgi:hypothetical protein